MVVAAEDRCLWFDQPADLQTRDAELLQQPCDVARATRWSACLVVGTAAAVTGLRRAFGRSFVHLFIHSGVGRSLARSPAGS